MNFSERGCYLLNSRIYYLWEKLALGSILISHVVLKANLHSVQIKA